MIGQTNTKIHSHKLQRKLRSSMTDAERILWQILRSQQVQGIKFRRQHPFGDYILDFVSLEIKLIIEVDGGQHASQFEYDQFRTEYLQSAGYQMLRFWNNEVIMEIEAVKEKIWMVVEEIVNLQPQQPHPHPNLPLEGEGTKTRKSKLENLRTKNFI